MVLATGSGRSGRGQIPSLFDAVLPVADAASQGSHIRGPRDEALRLSHSSFTLPDSLSALSVSVTAPQSEIEASLAEVRRPLAIALAVLGLALALAVLLQVTAGLKVSTGSERTSAKSATERHSRSLFRPLRKSDQYR
ncbi:hypothetical protein QWZ10_03570 [Paracoccus cavernae]|uniref:Uncharacterized protein n=1 Tax=Paracoccus cavernae TaxID=1571207 RepID=A0ABT8D5D7_9RHOB|nr:hypothetical protein [Paracoccus cavernae]